MDETILLALLQDGLTTGAIYVLLAVGLLIAFTVTRVIFIPQGDLVSFAALTLAAMIGHRSPARSGCSMSSAPSRWPCPSRADG